MTLKRDFIFKLVFSKNKEPLIDLLKSITKYEIKDIKILSKDFTLEKYRKDSKFGILDILTELEDGTKINIEMQVTNEHNTIERFLFYQSKIYTESMKAGEDYSKAKNVIVIGILDFELFIDEYNYISETNYKIEKVDKNGVVHEVQNLNTKMKMFLIELPKFKKVKHNLNEKLVQWLIAILCEDMKEMGEVMGINNNIVKLYKEVEKLVEDEDILEYIEREEDDKRKYNDAMKNNYDRGLEEGREEGIQQGKVIIAEKLLKNNMSIEQISEITTLSKQEILEIRNNK